MSNDAQRNPSADPDAGKVAQTCLDLLLIEIVPLAQRLAEELWNVDQDAMGVPNEKRQRLDPEEMRDSVQYRLDTLGYRVGFGVVESLTASLPLLSRAEPLDTIKFLCKDLWTSVFRKQIDNLKTNHRGVFVLTDNVFYPLRRCSLEAGRADGAAAKAAPFLYFPAGLLRGACMALGMEVMVGGEVAGVGLPGAVFTVRLKGAK